MSCPDPAAWPLATKRSQRRRVLMVLGWYDYEMNRGIAAYAHEAHWLLDDTTKHSVPPPRHAQWSGIITLLGPYDTPTAGALMRHRIPIVDLNNELRKLHLARVLADNQAIGRMAADHLIRCGLRNLAYCQLGVAKVEEERMAGFKAAASEAGAEFFHLDGSRIRGKHHSPSRRREVGRMLTKLPLPVGVMGQYDGSANEVVLACESVGLAVPEQVAVIGVDNDLITSELGLVPLTSVDCDRFRIGYEGAKLLDRLMRGSKPPRQPILIPPKSVVVRQSSNILAIKDAPLERALRYIWTHYAEKINVDTVAKIALVSRRKLYYLFAQHRGHSIYQEIERVRVEHARRQLRDTDLKISEVARHSGLGSGAQMCRVFVRELGMAPSAFRLRQRNA